MDKNISGNILILVSDAGYGHRSAANALVESFKRWPNLNVQIENPMDVKSVPLIIKETEDNYDSLVNKLPELYLMAYKASNFPPATSMLEAILSVTLYDAVRKTIEKYPSVEFIKK